MPFKGPVIRGVRYFLAHTPGLVRHGSKPARDIRDEPGLLPALSSNLRGFPEAAAYPPNQAFLGALYPDDLRELPRPWYEVTSGLTNGKLLRWGPHGELMPEEELCGLLKISDPFDLVWLEEGFVKEAASALRLHPLVSPADLDLLGVGHSFSSIEAQVAGPEAALPLYLRDGRIIGCVNKAHAEDESLTPGVLLENLACKASAAMALRSLLTQPGMNTESIDYVINCGEEAVGERYQRGGGNLAKAIAEMCGCVNATGADVKAFCCGPVHSLVMAAALVHSGVFHQVAVVAGCSLAKLGMKFRGHLNRGQPVLEDMLAGVAILVGEEDGISPRIRLDSVGRHSVGAGASQQAILECLVAEPLSRLSLPFRQVDKYATELHNPELTEPSGSGNVALLNYKLIAAMATMKEEISRADIPVFVETHGMPGFSPTQGHIASAVPFLGHALRKIMSGEMERVMFLAKGSLFLGRMTQLADGMSFMLEKNR